LRFAAIYDTLIHGITTHVACESEDHRTVPAFDYKIGLLLFFQMGRIERKTA